jgi:CelD/BcsL family acetyltransferase involved in cellulose biosynthesis
MARCEIATAFAGDGELSGRALHALYDKRFRAEFRRARRRHQTGGSAPYHYYSFPQNIRAAPRFARPFL